MNDRQNILKFFVDAENGNVPIPETILDNIPAVIFLYDCVEQKISYVNRKFQDYFAGVFPHINSSEDLLEDIIHPEDLENFRLQIKALSGQGAGYEQVFTCRLKNMEERESIFKITASLLSKSASGELENVLFIANDTTAQMKSEAIMNAKSELFDETESLLKFGSWVWEPLTGKVSWSNGIYKLFGYVDEKQAGEPLTMEFIQKHILPESKENVQALLDQVAVSPQDFEIEFCIETNDGVVKTLSSKARNVTENNNIRFIGVIRDVSEMRNLQQQQEKHLSELNRSNKELEEFAYVASHDLQEPLRKISMFSERLRSKYGPQLDQDGKLFMDRIVVSAENMRVLIDNLLEFSRANRSSKAFETISLSEVFNQVTTNLELKIEETKAQIIFETELPALEAVPSEMQQLFTNLLSNSIKFHRPDEALQVKIRSRKATREDKKNFSLKPNVIHYVVEVEDNGIGFEEEYAEKIFQIFQRLHGKAEYPGSGIGLSICKRIVQNHNGIIFATSTPGAGSRFTVILPEKQL